MNATLTVTDEATCLAGEQLIITTGNGTHVVGRIATDIDLLTSDAGVEMTCTPVLADGADGVNWAVVALAVVAGWFVVSRSFRLGGQANRYKARVVR